jgi:flagellar hook-basal body complex protein FliE
VTGIAAISAVAAPDAAPIAMRLGGAATPGAPQAGTASFADVLMTGLRGVDAKVATADKLVQQFAVDDSVPVHQVTMALADAKMAVELAMQVRTRVVEGFREIMNMPL